MPTRRVFIEQILRQIYGGVPNDDSEITPNLVNVWLNQGIGIAAKANYTDSIKIDGIAYINDSFYTTFKGLSIQSDEAGLWKVTLPHIPFGLGSGDGISTLQLKDTNDVSHPAVWVSQSQKSYYQNMRNIPNKFLAYSEGKFVYIISPLYISQYTASVTMVSGGDSSNLDSELNVPADYLPVITDYVVKQLTFERNQPQDVFNNGNDSIRTT